MSKGDSLRLLGRFFDECEPDGTDVRVTEEGVTVTDSTASAAVELSLSAVGRDESSVEFRDVALDRDGALVLTLEPTADVLATETRGVDVEPNAVRCDASAAVSITATVTAAANGAPEEPADDVGSTATPNRDDEECSRPERVTDARETASTLVDGTADHEVEVPPFEDHALLADIYDSCETFAEMADVIEMDVSGETVRRYMIQQGIHEPASYDTGRTTGGSGRDESTDRIPDGTETEPTVDRDRDDAAPEVVTDGMGLPESVSVDDIVGAVETSRTIYEVGRAIGVDRMDALAMLQEFDLLEFVMGRLADEPAPEVGRDRILRRITRAADAR